MHFFSEISKTTIPLLLWMAINNVVTSLELHSGHIDIKPGPKMTIGCSEILLWSFVLAFHWSNTPLWRMQLQWHQQSKRDTHYQMMLFLQSSNEYAAQFLPLVMIIKRSHSPPLIDCHPNLWLRNLVDIQDPQIVFPRSSSKRKTCFYFQLCAGLEMTKKCCFFSKVDTTSNKKWKLLLTFRYVK